MTDKEFQDHTQLIREQTANMTDDEAKHARDFNEQTSRVCFLTRLDNDPERGLLWRPNYGSSKKPGTVGKYLVHGVTFTLR